MGSSLEGAASAVVKNGASWVQATEDLRVARPGVSCDAPCKQFLSWSKDGAKWLD